MPAQNNCILKGLGQITLPVCGTMADINDSDASNAQKFEFLVIGPAISPLHIVPQ
jgi:hypothetical protein